MPTPVTSTHNVFFAGIGGTGIVTVNQVLATAALRAGYDVESLDQIGLSQKAGPVVSHLRFAPGKLDPANRLTPGSADCIVAFDLLTAADTKNLGYGDPAKTVSVASTSKTPTGDMVYDKTIAYPETTYLLNRLGQVSHSVHSFDAQMPRRRCSVHRRRQLPADRCRVSDRGAENSGVLDRRGHRDQRRGGRDEHRRLPLGAGRDRRSGALP